MRSFEEIPFLDLEKVNFDFQNQINDSVFKVINSKEYILGEQLSLFEQEYAKYNNVKHCIGVGSGLDALTFLLIAAGIKQQDEVIVPAHTFVATWLSVTNIGAKPIPVEPDKTTYNIDPKLIRDSITPKTKAIVVVNLYGKTAELERIKKIAKKHNLYLFEDAAQSHGARYKKLNSHYYSDGAATSFYPGKNLGCMGDGGAVLTNNDEFAEKIKMIRNYGSIQKYEHLMSGHNSRLDEIQASILRVKLKNLDAMNLKRKKIAEFYLKNIKSHNIVLPINKENLNHVWHLFVIRLKNRDRVNKKLLKSGIQTLIHYPIPPHKQKCYLNLKIKPLPITEKICSEIISLPLYPNMPKEHYEFIVSQINHIS